MYFRTVSSSTSPSTESPSKSIQPSLKPSSIWTRGGGFFMPCDLNRSSQDSRGTASMRTGRPRILENAAAISFGLTRRGPSNSKVRRPVHVSWSNSATVRPTSAVATIGNGLSSGCRKLEITPVLRAKATSQAAFSINQPGRRKVMGIPQAAKCLLHQTEFGEQIGAGCLRADCRDAHDLGRVCCLKGGSHGIDRSPRLWETRLWIEDRRREYEDAVRCLECRCECCRVIHLRQCQLTATF